MRVFLSRFTPGLKPGQGSSINWEIGERTVVISGPDQGRVFVVQSEGMSHDAAPQGHFVREGYFEDNPGHRCAKLESILWFAGDLDGGEQ